MEKISKAKELLAGLVLEQKSEKAFTEDSASSERLVSFSPGEPFVR